jgi:DNA invertase Pin-like site-specific DNA recombinase
MAPDLILPPKRTRVSAKQRRTAAAATKAVGVLRVSTQAQEASGLGLKAQIEAIEAFAVDKGLDLVSSYSDTASGKTAPSDRPGMAQALADLAAGQAGVLLAARADRLTRVTSDLYGLMDLSAREGWCIRTADAVVDTCSESGQLMAKVAGLFAEQERKLISARTSAALQAKKAQGHRLGREVSTDPATRGRIRELRLTGTTMQGVAAILNEEGVTTVTGKSWTWQNIQRVCNSLQLDDQTALAAGRADDVPHRPNRRLHVPGSSST